MEDNNVFAAYRAIIEKRLREQVIRTRSVDPRASTERIKDIQRKQEIERLANVSDPDIRAGLTDWVNELFKKL